MEPLRLRPYQVEDVRIMASGVDGASLNANPMGLGKTLEAVEAAKLMASGDPTLQRVLIIAPLNTHNSWVNTIRRQIHPDAPVYVLPAGSSKTKKAKAWWERVWAKQPGFYIMGWEAMRGMPSAEQQELWREAELRARELGLTKPRKPINQSWKPFGVWGLVIADEVHRATNRKSIVTRTLNTVQAKRKIALSGTPAGNKIEGFWPVLRWLWPKRTDRSYHRWVEQYCQTEHDHFAGLVVTGERYPGIIADSIPTYIRRSWDEVQLDMPEVITRSVRVPLKAGVQSLEYKRMEEYAFAWLEGQSLNQTLDVHISMRLRQIALGVPKVRETGRMFQVWRRNLHTGKPEKVDSPYPEIEVSFREDAQSNKIDALKEIIADLPRDEPVLILTHSAVFTVPVVHQLNRSGHGKAVGWTGQTSHEERMEILRTFARPGGPRFIVAGIAAIGEGVDGLQHVCHTEIWLSQHDNNLLNQQAEARVHRPGQTKPVNRIYIESIGTVDTQVYTRTSENANQMRALYRKENPR